MTWVGLQCVIKVFPDLTHLLFGIDFDSEASAFDKDMPESYSTDLRKMHRKVKAI